MKNCFTSHLVGAVSLLLIAIATQNSAYAYPSGQLHFSPKPKAVEINRLQIGSDLDRVAYLRAQFLFHHSPKVFNGMGLIAYPSGTLPIPPKPKAKADEEGLAYENAELESFPAGSIPVPPKPKAVDDMDLIAYPSGTLPIPPKPKAKADEEVLVYENIELLSFPSGTIPIPPKPKAVEINRQQGVDEVAYLAETIPASLKSNASI